MKYIYHLPEDELEFQMFVLDELADKRLKEGKDIIKVTIGVSELPINDKINRAISESIWDPIKTIKVYPEGLPNLRIAIADYYNSQFNTNVDFNQIFINSGSSAVYRNLFQLLSNSNLEILLPNPYYSLYKLSAILSGAKIKYYNIDTNNGSVDIQSFKDNYSSRKTSVVVINNPGNPLGNIISKKDIQEINSIVSGQSFILHDEIYNNVMFYDQYNSPLNYLSKYKESHIVTNSFSKGFRMYTKRIGYCIVPQKLRMPLRILQQHTLLTSDPSTQFGMIEALANLKDTEDLMILYRARAEYAYENLISSKCNPFKALGGFYISVDCQTFISSNNMKSSKELAIDILDTVNVAVVPGTDFGLDNWLRISFCSPRFEEAIDRLKKYFS